MKKAYIQPAIKMVTIRKTQMICNSDRSVKQIKYHTGTHFIYEDKMDEDDR